jgi:DNA-binding GntR family transcriptional regulator
MMMLIGAVESVCTARATAWAIDGADEPDSPIQDQAYRQRGFEDHSLILAFIERGDPEAAAREAQRHLQWVPVYPPVRVEPPPSSRLTRSKRPGARR